MPEKTNNTAILVFIRDPKREAKEKVFAKHIGIPGNQKLAKKLNQRIISISRKSGIPVFVYDSSKQQGFTFGDRFVNALSSVFEKGFENVISVGNDCLSLCENTLLKAKEELRKNELVLGPTFDGGFYLIGVSKKTFDPLTFKNFNWTTSHLADDFQSFSLKHKLAVSYFETANDIDNEEDLIHVLKKLPKLIYIRRVIDVILSIFTPQCYNFCNFFINPNLLRFSLLRAPPGL